MAGVNNARSLAPKSSANPQNNAEPIVMDSTTATVLAQNQLAEHDLERTLHALMRPSIDAADLYFQFSETEHWFLEDDLVKSGAHSREQGVGVRAISGEKTGFAYSDEINVPALTQAATAAAGIASHGGTGSVKVWNTPSAVQALYQTDSPLAGFEDAAKLALLRRAEAAARAAEPCVERVIVNLAAGHDVIMIAASDGTLAADQRPIVRMNVTVIVHKDGKREQASMGGGGRRNLQWMANSELPEQWAREAVRQALVRLDAEAAPAGTMNVVLGPGWPGVLLHEAVGHGLEGDFNRKGTSAYSGKIGQKVASELCTIVDDGTLENRRGSLTIDDEGTPSNCTTLIENGILAGYMQDKHNAQLMGASPTGNGRRESFAHLPMPRMTNTYMQPGESDPQEILASMKDGLYFKNFEGGQVDITSGNFVFTASEAYKIENGKLAAPVKGATLVGNGPEVLGRVSMVGNDLELDSGIGVCGKDGQSVPVGVGQPTLRIDGITVGGTQA